MFSMLDFICREPDNAVSEVSCDVEPSKCFFTKRKCKAQMHLPECLRDSLTESQWAENTNRCQTFKGGHRHIFSLYECLRGAPVEVQPTIKNCQGFALINRCGHNKFLF